MSLATLTTASTPLAAISKAQIAVLVTQCVGTPVSQSGTYSLGGVFGNVTISADGVTLRDTVISGDLYVTGGVGLGGVKLENVTVLGRIIASGGGESESGQASILLRNVTADELLVDNLNENTVTVQADGITEIGRTTVRTNAYIEDNTPDGMGLKYISLEGDRRRRRAACAWMWPAALRRSSTRPPTPWSRPQRAR